jgi:hypothetical protein
MLVALVKDIPQDIEAKVDQGLQVLVGLVLAQNFLQSFEAKVLLLDLDQLIDMVSQLVTLKLSQVVFAQNHVLDQLDDFLVELDDVGLLMHELLDLLPVFEERVIAWALSSTTETVNNLAEELASVHC